MQTRPVAVQLHFPSALSSNADWADAYEIETRRNFLDMRSTALCSVGGMPRWAKPLLWLRNLLGVPFDLKPRHHRGIEAGADRIAFFPVLSENDAQIVPGLDDRHDLFGRPYIFFITPFHKWILRSVLSNAL